MKRNPLLSRIAAAVLLAAALLSVPSCRKGFEKPETGRYYDITADGERYFVLFDSYDDNGLAKGHFYTVEDTLAYRHDVLAKFNRNRISVQADGKEVRLKYSKVSCSEYVEPPYKEGDLLVYRKKYCKVSATPDICFGHAEGYWTSLQGAEQDLSRIFTQGYIKSFKKKDLELTLDLYRPEGIQGKRPLILFIHGGAFYIGNKEEPAYIDFCRHFAEMGYITASMNYRLGFHISKNEIERAGYVALQDAHAALRFLCANADEYGIDPGRVFVAGSSAGAITALNLAFMNDEVRPDSSRGKKAFLTNRKDLGDIDSSGNDLKADFKIAAIANMWGAITDLELMDNAKTSIVSFHGEADTTVPYGEGYPLASAGETLAKMLSELMYGSSCIDKKAEEAGLRHRFYSFPGEKHALNTTGKDKTPNRNHDFIKSRMEEFFFEEMVQETASMRWESPGCYSVSGTGISDVQWKVDGGFIFPEENGKVRVIWCVEKNHGLTAAGTYGNGIGWVSQLQVDKVL